MALALSAEQKSLMRIFFNEDRFIIPDYQRPYSWGYDECFQLFSDITSAYLDGAQDYFLGNIIMARATSESETDANIVDGQQRLITIWMLLKCMSLLLPDIKKIQKALSTEPWDEDCLVPKILSKEEEHQSLERIKAIWELDNTRTLALVEHFFDGTDHIDDSNIDNKYLCNFLNIYILMKKFLTPMTSDDQILFWNFFINKIYLLPIELQGKTMEEAEGKAMVIFETINNRGLDLRDADIFKARLYKKAKSRGLENDFVSQWYDFTTECERLNVTVDDVFRYYMHIVRGKNKITDREKSLRDFFINEQFSPIRKLDYQNVLEDLTYITSILQYIKNELTQNSEVCKWLQIMFEYSNNYPQYAFVSYLYKNGYDGNQECIVSFLQKIVRYCYSCGATRSVKFEIYNIIKNIFFDIVISDYKSIVQDSSTFPYLGMLKNGFALLAYYLENSGDALISYNVDRLIKESDRKYLSSWDNVELDVAMTRLANYVILDIPVKRIPITRKYTYYSTSKLADVRSILTDNGGIYQSKFTSRDERLTRALLKFFE